jgi:hypothetical protein
LPQRHERGEQVDSNADQGTPTLLGKERRRRVLGERHLLRVCESMRSTTTSIVRTARSGRPHRSSRYPAPPLTSTGFRARLRDLISGVIREYAQAA